MGEILNSEPHTVGGQNANYDWSKVGADDCGYILRNYREPSKEDLAIADGIIDRVGTLSLGHAMTLRDIGTWGTLRTAALAYPLLDSMKAKVLLTDNASPQLLLTTESVLGVISGDLGIWASHQTAMTKRDPRWYRAVRGMCEIANERQQNLWELPESSTDIATEGHTLCSSTGNPEEYAEGVAAFYNQLTPGGIAIRLFMIGSTGYRSGDIFYPAMSITPDDVELEAERMGMNVIGRAFGVAVDSRAHGSARDSDDPTTYEGYGGAVLEKPNSSRVAIT